MTDRELMQMALEALGLFASDESDDGQMAIAACVALRDRLAQPEHVHASDISQECVDETRKDRHEPVEYLTPVSWYGDQPLYAKPTCTAPPKREWVRLTDEEVHDAFNFVEFVKQVSFDRDRPEWCENFAAYLETKLKEKNCGV